MMLHSTAISQHQPEQVLESSDSIKTQPSPQVSEAADPVSKWGLLPSLGYLSCDVIFPNSYNHVAYLIRAH